MPALDYVQWKEVYWHDDYEQCPCCHGFGEIAIISLGIDFVEIEDVECCPVCLGEGRVNVYDNFDVEF